MKPLKIFAAHDGGSGCAWYRMTMPLQELARHPGFEVTFADAGDSNGPHTVTARHLEGYDIIVGQRLSKHDGLQVWRGARTPFSRLVYETDDDVWTINPENWQAYTHFRDETIRDAITHGAQVADLITVSTPHLAQVMTGHTGNANVAVLPNCVPSWVTQGPRAARARPAIGWQGGASHGVDVGIIVQPVRRFLKRFPAWDLRLCGTDYRPTFRLPKARADFSTWVRVNDDPRGYYATMDFDIGLAPLADNDFNRSKSMIKCLEYNALGIPVIASDVEPYRDYITDGVNGFLIRYEHDWLKRMSELATDAGLREKMSASAREVARAHTIEGSWSSWASAYAGMFPARA